MGVYSKVRKVTPVEACGSTLFAEIFNRFAALKSTPRASICWSDLFKCKFHWFTITMYNRRAWGFRGTPRFSEGGLNSIMRPINSRLYLSCKSSFRLQPCVNGAITLKTQKFEGDKMGPFWVPSLILQKKFAETQKPGLVLWHYACLDIGIHPVSAASILLWNSVWLLFDQKINTFGGPHQRN